MRPKHINPMNWQAAYAAVAMSALLTLAQTLPAGPRTSANYSVATDTTDTGGQRTTSSSYTNDGSAGLIAGLATVASPAASAKAGYIGQLYEVTGFDLTSEPPAVDEGASAQLAAWQVLDDASQLAVLPTAVAWSVVSGPLTGISAAGLASAGLVYQNTAATVRGSYASLTGTFDLTVLNVLPDNFGSNAGDGVDDAWQNQYFGLNNPDAGPDADPDGDGQDNQFEFSAGLVPTDAASRFPLRVEPVAGQSMQKRLVFSPRLDGRTYDILTSSTLASDSWSALTGGSVSDNADERTVTDQASTTALIFYRIESTRL
jgi:hypothetical protein